MKTLLSIAVFIALVCSANAQFYDEVLMDSLQRIVNNPVTKDADRINPLARLSRMYMSLGDSVNATEALTQARTLALREKDSKYMIYVYNQELASCINVFPRKIILAYQIIDSVYIAIKKTSDPEAQALGYNSVGWVKTATKSDYDFGDSYKALSLAEKLPEKSIKKYKIMGDIYTTMCIKYLYTDSLSFRKYLNLLQQAAEKSDDKSYLCSVMNLKLNFDLQYFENDKKLIAHDFAALENFISENVNKLLPVDYGFAVGTLTAAYLLIPNAQNIKKLDKHIEIFKKMAKNNLANKITLLNIEINYALMQKNYAEVINFAHQIIEIDEIIDPMSLSKDYEDLASLYSETKQYKQAVEAFKKSVDYKQQYQNAKLDEQRQLAEVKFGLEKKERQIEQQRSHIFIINITAILVIVILILLILILFRQKKINQLEKEKAKLIAQQAIEEKDIIGKKLIVNTSELNRKDRLIEKAKDLDKEQLVRAIRYEQKKSKLTGDHIKLFNEINPEFYKRLQAQATPNKLSHTDLNYCAYISLRMSNKELANVMDTEYNTVIKQKSRLKKKLHLSKNDDLEAFITGVVLSYNI